MAELQRTFPKRVTKATPESEPIRRRNGSQTLNCQEIEGDGDNSSKQTDKWKNQVMINRLF